jgi:hypothetical protein
VANFTATSSYEITRQFFGYEGHIEGLYREFQEVLNMSEIERDGYLAELGTASWGSFYTLEDNLLEHVNQLKHNLEVVTKGLAYSDLLPDIPATEEFFVHRSGDLDHKAFFDKVLFFKNGGNAVPI